MSTLAASNLNEPPPKSNQPPLPSPSLFSSLPNDIILDIIARVPKRHYPILSCVSKTFKILVRSPEIQKLRSLLGKDSLYICFVNDNTYKCMWFTLHGMEKNPTNNLVYFSFPPHYDHYSVIAVGPELFFIGGYGSMFSSSMWIFDSRSGKYRQGPNMQVERNYTSTVGLVGGKIYVIGWDKDENSRAEFFDLKTQTWNRAPIPEKGLYTWMCPVNSFVLERKVCSLSLHSITSYDIRNGSCENIEFANTEWCRTGVCVIDNVLYVYYKKLGLMWYDSKLRQWRMVNGLDHLNNTHQSVGLAEYYGKLAYMWTELDVGSETKQIWCKMIVLDRNEVGIHGKAEPSQLLGIISHGYSLRKCFSLLG